jgi:hypothetical protein
MRFLLTLLPTSFYLACNPVFSDLLNDSFVPSNSDGHVSLPRKATQLNLWTGDFGDRRCWTYRKDTHEQSPGQPLRAGGVFYLICSYSHSGSGPSRQLSAHYTEHHARPVRLTRTLGVCLDGMRTNITAR